MGRQLADWLEAYMEYVEDSEPPLLFKRWAGISTIASALQRKCWIEWGHLTFYPNMYIILVAQSGKCRKGTAMAPAYDLLENLNIPMAAESITREALIRELKNSTSSEIDITTGTMRIHASLTVFSPELTVFLGYNNLALMTDLTDWYDCRKTWTYRTKNMGTDEIKNIWVNLIGATTPEMVQTGLPRDAIGGGLTSRMVFVFEDRKYKQCPLPFLSEQALAMKPRLMNDLEEIKMMRGQFKMTEDFLDRWADWYPTSDRSANLDEAHFAGYIERRPTHIMKLCMILNASRTDSMVIDCIDFDRALKILTDTEVKMGRTFMGVGKNLTADVTQRVIGKLAAEGQCTLSDLMKTFYHDADLETMKAVLAAIESMGFCSITPIPRDQGGGLIVKYVRKKQLG